MMIVICILWYNPLYVNYHSVPLATGILKGYDQLLNLVLDNTVEYMRGKLVTMVTIVSKVTLIKQILMISLRFWMRHVN